MAAGSIVVDLLMKTGTFETDTARASKALKQFKKDADAIGKTIGVAFVAGATGLAYLVKSSIDAEDHLNDLSKKTGIAVETLGGIGFAAQQSGSDLDSASAAAGKLNKSIAEAAAGNAQAAEAFNVLGISVKDASGASKSADVVLAELADKFATYADGPEKAALALRIFGKAGADIIPLLDEGGAALRANIDYYKKYSGVTTETASASDQFNDTLTKLHLLSGAFGKTLTAELLPSLQGLANLFLENKEKGDQFRGVASDLAELIKTLAFSAIAAGQGFLAFGKAIGGTLAAVDAFKQGRFGEALNIGKETLADLNTAKDRISGVYDAIFDGKQKAGAFDVIDFGVGNGFDGPKKAAPRLSGTAPGGPADDPTKKLLDNQIKAIQAAIEREKDLFQTRNDFIELYNSQSLLSLKDYYSARRVASDDATKAELDGITQQIQAERAFAALPTTSKVDRAGAEGKIADLIAKRAKIEQEAGAKSILLSEQERFAAEALAKQFQSVNAQVLDLQENFSAAAAIKFDLQFDALSRVFSNNGNTAGQEAIATLRAATIAQAAFQKASLDSSRTLEDLALLEERIGIAQQTGAIGELEGLAKVGQARRDKIALLERELAIQQTIAGDAKLSGAANADELIRKAAQAQVALDRLKASSDPLAESLNKTFGGDFNDALTDFVTGTKSASDAFKSFAKSVLNDILKMGSKSITESIFGGSGGAGGLLSGLFGSGSSQGGLASLLGSAGGGLASLFGGAGGGLASLFGSAGNIQGIGDKYNGAGGLLDFFSGFFADGGVIPPGKVGIVGERGPELAFGGTGGQTIANKVGSTTHNVNVSVQATPGMNRDTAMQQGAAIGLGIQQALARNS